MASGEGILRLLNIKMSPPPSSTSKDEEDKGSVGDGHGTAGEDPCNSIPKERQLRHGTRSRGQWYHPAEPIINFQAPTFWERKEIELVERGVNQGRQTRHTRSLFTANSNNAENSNQREILRQARRPEGVRRQPRTFREEHGTGVSVSNTSIVSSQSPFNPRKIMSRPQLNIQREVTSPLKMAFNSRGEPVDDKILGALVTDDGIITVRLHQGVKVDITIDKAIRMQNNPASVIVAVSADGSTSALIHPSGRVYQYGSRVEITTSDVNGNTKLAKMSHRGISFTSAPSIVVYVVDTAGTRSTSDVYSDMSGDFSVPVFESEAKIGHEYMDQAMAILHQSQYWLTTDGIENWLINGIRVSQAPDGLVRVNRSASKYQFRSSPLNGTVNLGTPYVHCTASVGEACHLFVKRGERRLHFDGGSFIVRNAGHSAGYDENNQLKVY